MDSLLANYASSDDDGDEQQQQQVVKHHHPSITTNNTHIHKTTPSSSSSSLSLFSSLPPPKSQTFSSPLPQTHFSSSFPNPSDPTPKRVVVQFKPPPKPSDSDSDDDDEAPKKDPKRLRDSSSAGDPSSVRSFLSSIPAPKNSSSSSSSSTTLGVGVSGSSRRSTIEYEAPPADVGQVDDSSSGGFQQPPHYVDYSSSCGDGIGFDYNAGDGYGENYGQIASSNAAVPVPVPVPRKRGRKDVATEIVEVKQDDLTKNRPREDQVKLTGIAFGPSSYQPVSAKGKPSKLHKRKHQIGSLFYDMKQKEMELSERRARGFLTKAQTQGKYGW